MLKNTQDAYGLMAIILHWLVGLMIIVMLIVGYNMVDIPPSDEKTQIYAMHKATGTVVLMLVFIRIWWRLINVSVSLPLSVPQWHQAAARAGHYALYLFMILMPSSGMLMTILSGREINVFGMFIVPALSKQPIAGVFHTIHVYSSYVLAALVIGHSMVALYNHFVLKNNVLVRMLKVYIR